MKKNEIVFLLTIILFQNLGFAQTNRKPLVIGESELLSSAFLNESRIINVYFPGDYTPNDTLKYPVVYVLDGGIEEDFMHIAGIVRFNTQPWIARFPSSIVVGIEGNSRRKDFTFAVTNTDFIEKEGFKKVSFQQYGGSENYINFIEKELQPYIEKTYRTNKKKTIIGESLAGLLTTEIVLKRPYLFNDYIIISPSLWWGGEDESLLKNAEEFLSKNLKNEVNIYVGAPNKDEDVRMYNEAEALYKTFKSDKNINVKFDYMPEESHSTVIHQAVYNAFKMLYPKTAY